MYAIVDIGGFQYKVEKDRKYFVSRLNQEEGSKVDFDNVLLVDNEGDVKVGKPTVDGAKVSAKVVSHAKADKKIVFKKKRRTGFRVKKGHRQPLTQIEVEDIVA
ncbi:MAG: 50S ribosomal protein L21 [Bacteroidota bacterium]